MVKSHILFVKRTIKRKIEPITLGFMAEGNVYLCGKDRKERAILYFSFRQKIRSNELDEYFSLIDMLLLIVRCKSCIPGYLEKMIFVVDLIDCNCSKIFIKMVNYSNKIVF